MQIKGHKKFIAPLRRAYAEAVEEALEADWSHRAIQAATQGDFPNVEDDLEPLRNVRAAWLDWNEAEIEEVQQRIRDNRN